MLRHTSPHEFKDEEGRVHIAWKIKSFRSILRQHARALCSMNVWAKKKRRKKELVGMEGFVFSREVDVRFAQVKSSWQAFPRLRSRSQQKDSLQKLPKGAGSFFSFIPLAFKPKHVFVCVLASSRYAKISKVAPRHSHNSKWSNTRILSSFTCPWNKIYVPHRRLLRSSCPALFALIFSQQKFVSFLMLDR